MPDLAPAYGPRRVGCPGCHRSRRVDGDRFERHLAPGSDRSCRWSGHRIPLRTCPDCGAELEPQRDGDHLRFPPHRHPGTSDDCTGSRLAAGLAVPVRVVPDPDPEADG